MIWDVRNVENAMTHRVTPAMGGSGEDDYTASLQEMVSRLRKVPGRVSERAIRQLAANNKLEVFEDQIAGGKRLSIGGLIILIDIDFKLPSGEVMDVKVSFASTTNPTNEAASFRSKSLSSSIDALLLKTLKQPRLDEFSRVLCFLSKGDQLSVAKAPDCFALIDEVSNALFQVYKGQEDPLIPYGVPELNPGCNAGLGIWYWTKNAQFNPIKHYVLWSMRQGSENPAGYSTEWVKSANGDVEWNEPTKIENSKAEFVLELAPPIKVPVHLAQELHKQVDGEVTSEECMGRYQRKVYMKENEGCFFEFMYANLVPSEMMSLSEIPISHPKEMPHVLSKLRQLAIISTLWESVIEDSQRGELEQQSIDARMQQEEISFADAIMEEETLDQSKQTPSKLSASISLVQINSDRPAISITVQTVGSLTILPNPDGIEVNCSSLSEDCRLKIEKTVQFLENIPLACSAMVHYHRESEADGNTGGGQSAPNNPIVGMTY